MAALVQATAYEHSATGVVVERGSRNLVWLAVGVAALVFFLLVGVVSQASVEVQSAVLAFAAVGASIAGAWYLDHRRNS